MEILGGALLAIVLLSVLGSVTALAFASMAFLSLVTEMSFKRIFFTSFGVGLLAPILIGLGVSSTLGDERVQRDILADVTEAISGSEEMIEALPRIRELREQLTDGTITADEFERQLQELVEERRGSGIELTGPETETQADPQAEPLPESE